MYVHTHIVQWGRGHIHTHVHIYTYTDTHTCILKRAHNYRVKCLSTPATESINRVLNKVDMAVTPREIEVDIRTR